MKKFAAGLLTAVIMINGSAALAESAAIVSISTDPDTQYITVSGTIESTNDRERVTLRITKKGEEPDGDTILCTYQVNTDENGDYIFGFTMPDDTAADEYDAYVKIDEAEDIQSFRYFGDISSVLEAEVNNASSVSQLRTFFEADNNAGMEMFGIDISEYEELSETGKDFVVSAVFDTKQNVQGFDNGKHLRDVFNQAVLIAQIREGIADINDDNIAALTVNYSEQENGGYAVFGTMYETAKKSGASTMSKALTATQADEVSDVEGFWNAYNNSVTNTVILSAEYWVEVRNFIDDNKELIGEKADINWTEYNSNTEAVCKTLVRGNYATLSAFAEAVKSALDKSLNSSAGSNGSNNGVGVSTGVSGSDIKSSPVSLPAPGNTDNSGVVSDLYKFDDMRRTPWANNAVSYLVDKNIINGYGDGTFRPESSITRAEFVTLAVKAFYGDYEMTDCDFADVSKDSWAYPYIAAASNLGLVQGIGSNQFDPNSNIRRQDMAVIIKNIFDRQEYSLPDENILFNDEKDISEYALAAVRMLRAAGIVNGDENNNFRPLSQTTRAEAAVIIYNMLNK